MDSLDVSVSLNTNHAPESSDGYQVGMSAQSKVGFHGVLPVVQRAGVAQAAIPTAPATNVSPYGYSSQAQADAIVTLLTEIRAALVEKGIIAGG